MANQENIHSITTKKVSQKISFFKSKYCYLIFTDRRIIVAYFDPEIMRDDYKLLLKNNTGLLQAGIRYRSTQEFYQRYLKMSPSEIIQEHPENFSILPLDIKSLVFLKGSCCQDEDGFESHNPDKLHITLKNNNRKNFYLQACFFHELCDAIQQIVPLASLKREKVSYHSEC